MSSRTSTSPSSSTLRTDPDLCYDQTDGDALQELGFAPCRFAGVDCSTDVSRQHLVYFEARKVAVRSVMAPAVQRSVIAPVVHGANRRGEVVARTGNHPHGAIEQRIELREQWVLQSSGTWRLPFPLVLTQWLG